MKKESAIFMLAGEASADALGGMVIEGLQRLGASPDCWGVGGDAMQQQGLRSIHPMDDFTILGFSQALQSLPRLNRLGDLLIEQIIDLRPDAVLTIDNKGFSMRFARRLKKRMGVAGWSAPILHLVAPTVWAWGAWRSRSIARSVDRLLCLFPFESAYFDGKGVEVTVTGHPAAERDRPSQEGARQKLGLGSSDKVLILLPGSRRREVKALLPDMLAASAIIRKAIGSLEVLVPVADTVADEVEAITGEVASDGRVRLCPAAMLDSALAAGDYGMICSGTVTLEAALAGLQGSVYYRPDWLSRMFGGIMVDRGKVVLANAVAGREVYPLFLGNEFKPETMAALAVDRLRNPSLVESRLVADAIGVEGGFAKNAAAAVMAEIERASQGPGQASHAS